MKNKKESIYRDYDPKKSNDELVKDMMYNYEQYQQKEYWAGQLSLLIQRIFDDEPPTKLTDIADEISVKLADKLIEDNTLPKEKVEKEYWLWNHYLYKYVDRLDSDFWIAILKTALHNLDEVHKMFQKLDQLEYEYEKLKTKNTEETQKALIRTKTLFHLHILKKSIEN